MAEERIYTCLPFEYIEQCEMLSDEEFGRLIRGLLFYSRDGIPIPTDTGGRECILARTVMATEDRFQRNFEESREAKSRFGRAAAQKRWQKSAAANPHSEPDDMADLCGSGSDEGGERGANSANAKTKAKAKTNTKAKAKELTPCNPPAGDPIPSETGEAVKKGQEKSGKSVQQKTHWAEFVTMTNAEHDKLVSTFGTDRTARAIEILNHYKGSNGKTYKSDYHAIRSWVMKRAQEDEEKEKGGISAYGSAGSQIYQPNPELFDENGNF